MQTITIDNIKGLFPGTFIPRIPTMSDGSMSKEIQRVFPKLGKYIFLFDAGFGSEDITEDIASLNIPELLWLNHFLGNSRIQGVIQNRLENEYKILRMAFNACVHHENSVQEFVKCLEDILTLDPNRIQKDKNIGEIFLSLLDIVLVNLETVHTSSSFLKSIPQDIKDIISYNEVKIGQRMFAFMAKNIRARNSQE